MKNPATGGGVLDSRSGEFDKTEFTLPTHNPQAAVRAIEAGLVSIAETDLPDFLRAEIDAPDLSVVIRRRLTERQRLYCATAFIWSLQIDIAEQRHLVGKKLAFAASGGKFLEYLGGTDG